MCIIAYFTVCQTCSKKSHSFDQCERLRILGLKWTGLGREIFKHLKMRLFRGFSNTMLMHSFLVAFLKQNWQHNWNATQNVSYIYSIRTARTSSAIHKEFSLNCSENQWVCTIFPLCGKVFLSTFKHINCWLEDFCVVYTKRPLRQLCIAVDILKGT